MNVGFPFGFLAIQQELGVQSQGGLFVTFGGKMIDPLVVKHSLVGGSPIFSQKVAKMTPRFNLQKELGVQSPGTPQNGFRFSFWS